jgi:hypothetical protein
LVVELARRSVAPPAACSTSTAGAVWAKMWGRSWSINAAIIRTGPMGTPALVFGCQALLVAGGHHSPTVLGPRSMRDADGWKTLRRRTGRHPTAP